MSPAVDLPQPQPLDNGLIVVFEGIDGVGKTTQIKLAQEALQTAGWTIDITRNLGGTPIGEALRDVIKSPLERPGLTNLYISAAIQEALIEKINKARQESKFILMDRGPLSLAAYAVFGDRQEESLGWPFVERGMAEIKPELIIIYEADVENALQHAQQKGEKADYFESKPHDYFERVAEGYRRIAERYPSVIRIDANQSLEAVHQETMQHIQQALAGKLTPS